MMVGGSWLRLLARLRGARYSRQKSLTVMAAWIWNGRVSEGMRGCDTGVVMNYLRYAPLPGMQGLFLFGKLLFT